MIHLILRAKRDMLSNQTASVMLEDAVARHMDLHIAAYGLGHIKPKHHWVHDVAQQMPKCPCVVDAFVIERLPCA